MCQEFCRHPQYFPAFLSCNEALRDVRGGQRWCRRCAKCAFVFLMLSAFLPPAVVEEVFGANLFRPGLSGHASQLAGGLEPPKTI